MTAHTYRPRFGLFGVIACCAAIIVGGVLAIGATRARQKPVDDRQVEQAKAYRTGGLKAAAAVTGKFTRTETAQYASPVSIDQLVSFSQAIVIATTDGNRSYLTADGTSVVSDFGFAVESTLKGQPASKHLLVVVPGGRVGFENGSWAQVNVAGFRRPQVDRRYVVFLRPALPSVVKGRSSQDLHEPSFGGNGIYDISNDSALARPIGGTDSTFAMSLGRRRLSCRDFLAAVREVIAKSAEGR